MLSKEFDIFKIEYTKDDLDYIDDLIDNLKNHYKEIIAFFNNTNFKDKIEIKLWNNLEEYRNYFNNLYKEKGYNNTVPLWETARSFTDKHPKIYLISYKESLKCKGHQKDTINIFIQTLVHEFVHSCHFNYNNHTDSLTWFLEALATNLSHQERYEKFPLIIDASLDDIMKGQANYTNYYVMGKYLLTHYDKDYILKLVKDKELLIKDTPKIYEETQKFYEVLKNEKSNIYKIH